MPSQQPRLRPSKARSLWLSGASTEGPGYTRFAVYVVIVSALIAVAQIVVGAIVVDRLEAYGNAELQCYQDMDEMQSRREELPITVVDMDSGDQGMGMWSIGRRTGMFPMTWFFLILPISSLVFSCTIAHAHVRSAGIANRMAVLYAAWMLLDWMGYMLADGALYVDRTGIEPDWPECYVDHETAVELWAQRRERLRLIWARGWVFLAGVIGTSVYLILALRAAHLAFKETQQNAAHPPGQIELRDMTNMTTRPLPPQPYGVPSHVRNTTQTRHSADNASQHHTIAFASNTPLRRASADSRRYGRDEERHVGTLDNVKTKDFAALPDADPRNPFADPVNPFDDPWKEGGTQEGWQRGRVFPTLEAKGLRGSRSSER